MSELHFKAVQTLCIKVSTKVRGQPLMVGKLSPINVSQSGGAE